MAKNSKKKGDAYERKIAKELGKHWGAEFNRVPQSGGLHWKSQQKVTGDIIPQEGSRFPFTVECKHREGGWTLESAVLNKLEVKLWWQQAITDAQRVDKVPCLIFTRNYSEDFVMLPFEKDTYVEYVYSNQPIMQTVVTYEHGVTKDSFSWLVMVTTLNGYRTLNKEHYIEKFENYNWQEYTSINVEEVEKADIKTQASNILDNMFGDYD